MQEVGVSDHAVARYAERVRPGLSFDDAERELLGVLALAEFSEVRPSWATGHAGMAGWLLLGDGVAFPVERAGRSLTATTCLVRGGASEAVLEARRVRRGRRRAHRRLVAEKTVAADRWGARQRRREAAA